MGNRAKSAVAPVRGVGVGYVERQKKLPIIELGRLGAGFRVRNII